MIKRILRTSPIPDGFESFESDAMVITPHRAAAEKFKVPHTSLRSLAMKILSSHNIGVVSRLEALIFLSSAIHRTNPELDSSAEAARLKEILGTVLRTGIDLDQLRNHGSIRAKFLADVAEKYVNALAGENLIDSEAVLWRASQFEVSKKKIIVYGHFRARKEEIVFINQLAGDGSILFLPLHDNPVFAVNHRWADWLKGRGWEAANSKDSDHQNETPCVRTALGFVGPGQIGSDAEATAEALSYQDVASEVRGTLARAKQLLITGTKPAAVSIVCRNIQPYSELLRSISQEYGIPLQFNHLIPIGQTELGNFIRLLFETVAPERDQHSFPDSPFEFETTARLLSHRFGPGMDANQWITARKELPNGSKEWQALGIDVSILRVPESQKRRAWIAWVRSVFERFDVRDKAGTSATEIIAFNRFLDALNRQSLHADDRVIPYLVFSSEIFDTLMTVTCPFGPSRGGVIVHQPNTIIGGEFDHVFVVGMAEGMLPAKVAENPIIDFYERKRLTKFGVEFEDASAVPRWESMSFYFVLLAATRGLTLSYPIYVDGDARIPCEYFNIMGIKPRPDESFYISSREELRSVCLIGSDSPVEDALLKAARRHFKVEDRRESSEPYDEYDGVIGQGLDPTKRKWSVSQLTKLGQCSFKWYSEKVLGLTAGEESDVDLPASTRGSLYHKVLEIAVEKSMSAVDIRSAVLSNLDEAFAEAEDSDEYSIARVAYWELQRNEHLEALRKAVRSAAFIADDTRVLEVEKWFETVWKGLPIIGLIDRIDERPEGVIAIDYKTGSYTGKIKDESGELKIDIQIPIYSQTALPHLFPDKSILQGIYLRLSKRVSDSGKDIDLDSFAEDVKETLKSGRFVVEPDVHSNACTYCDFDSVCRQGSRIELKRQK